LHILNDLRPEELITGLHIGEIEAGEKITEHREESVHHIMESPVYLRIRLLKPRSINHIGPLIEQGLQELGYVMNVVFKVSILDSNNLTSRCFDSTAQRRALALIYVLLYKDVLRLKRKSFDDGYRVILRAVINNHQLLLSR